MIGLLMYCATMICPDIVYTVSTLPQFLEVPWSTHMKAIKWVFCYLLGTKKLKLILRSNTTVTRFSDADWASQHHHHSISGYVYFVSLRTVLWSTKKQSIITLSSTEAEYVMLTHAAKDILWIHKLLKELPFLHLLSLLMTLYCDNQGAIHLSKDATFHECMKHIDIHFHFICQTVTSGDIKLVYIPTEDMTANIYTKSLAHVKFNKFQGDLNIVWLCLQWGGVLKFVIPVCITYLFMYCFHSYLTVSHLLIVWSFKLPIIHYLFYRPFVTIPPQCCIPHWGVL